MACKPGSGEPKADAGPVAVFAASSLREGFRALEERFEAAHPQFDVQLTFAGSQVLRLQLEQGAVADVFATADPSHIEALLSAGLLSSTAPLVANELVLIVPLSNPAQLTRFEDLGRVERFVIGAPNAPIGGYTQELLERAQAAYGDDFGMRVKRGVVSQESNVRLVRAKVELGEADAAIVYRTDAVSSDRLSTIQIPEALNVRARYSIATLSASRHADSANLFVQFALSEEGQRILVEHGFLRGRP